MADRVVLFVDYQNVYMAARQAFDPSPRAIPHWEGQVDPLVLGQLLVTRSPFDRALTGVRMYRGLPDSTKDPKGYGACMRQIATWSRPEEVQVVARPLRYPYGWPSTRQEAKGIDVSIAVDFVLMAARGDYDVGILMSADTDLKPALEAVVSLGAARVEVAAWSSQYGHSRRLAIKGRACGATGSMTLNIDLYKTLGTTPCLDQSWDHQSWLSPDAHVT
ncbi:MAG: NYN domain-containing protein [Acidimicrobiia bacterium]|nr:NYN domain-containing protein [Acidimicrobiia bacterium]